jgi:hypothetical protein
MPKYDVTLIRTSEKVLVVRIEAPTRLACGALAVDTSGDHDFNQGKESTPKYEIDSIEEIPEQPPKLLKRYIYWVKGGKGSKPRRHETTATNWLEGRRKAQLQLRKSGGPALHPMRLDLISVETFLEGHPGAELDRVITCSCGNSECMDVDEQRHHSQSFEWMHSFGADGGSPCEDLLEHGVYQCLKCKKLVVCEILPSEQEDL